MHKDIVIFGSLIIKSETSKNTILLKFISLAGYKPKIVFVSDTKEISSPPFIQDTIFKIVS